MEISLSGAGYDDTRRHRAILKRERKKNSIEREKFGRETSEIRAGFAFSGEGSDATELDLLKNQLKELRCPMIEGLIVRGVTFSFSLGLHLEA